MKVIALTGPKGSGKDTVADIIVNNYQHVTRVAFADPIKNVVQHIFKLDQTNNDQYDRIKRSRIEICGGDRETTWKNVDGRHVVREIGMIMRSYDPSQFTRYVSNQIIQARERSRIFVVTDLRFDNEYIMMKEYGAEIVKITRPDYHYDGHITERGFNDYLVDRIINNDSSLEVLKDQVMNMLKEYK